MIKQTVSGYVAQALLLEILRLDIVVGHQLNFILVVSVNCRISIVDQEEEGGQDRSADNHYVGDELSLVDAH